MVSFINSQHISTLHNLFFLFLFLLMIRSESVWYLVNWMWRTLGPTHHRPQSPTNTHISLDINVTKDLYSSYIKFSYFISETSRNVNSGKKEEQMCKCLMTMCFLRKLNILCSKSQILIFLYNSMSESWPQNVARGWRRGSVMLVLISNINYLWLITRIHNQSSQRHMLVPSLSAVSFTKNLTEKKKPPIITVKCQQKWWITSWKISLTLAFWNGCILTQHDSKKGGIKCFQFGCNNM